MSANPSKCVFGGIGDLIQTFEEAQELRRIKVFSHFRNARDFYDPFGIDIDLTVFDDYNEQIKKQALLYAPLRRTAYPRLKAPLQSHMNATKRLPVGQRREIVGIHP